MNKVVFKSTFKRNWKLLLIFFAVLCFYLGVIIYLVDPNDMDKIKNLYGSMGEMLSAFGITTATMTSPLSYTASTFFGVLVMGFTMVFYVIQANKLIGKSVDDTSIAYTLSMPISRTKLVMTQGVYLILSMTILFVGILATGAIALASMGDFDFLAYFDLVAVTCLLCTAMAMLSFFLSVVFCDSKKGIALSTGVPIAFLLISMMAGAGGESTKWLLKATPFGWLDSVGIVNGDVSTWWMYIVFFVLIVVLLFGSAAIFKKKRLSI